MSVKTMTTEAIQDDLDTINMTWPEGVPPEQADRVNALKAELKRRGEVPTPRPGRAQGRGARPDVDDMSRDDLEKELRVLSATISRDPEDADAQKRFADVRYALRSRSRNGEGDAPVPRTSTLPPRALELPDEDEAELRRRERERDATRKAAASMRDADYAKAVKRPAAPMPKATNTLVDEDVDLAGAALADADADDGVDARRLVPRRTARAAARRLRTWSATATSAARTSAPPRARPSCRSTTSTPGRAC